MYSYSAILFFTLVICTGILAQDAEVEPRKPEFRILAPQFVCPKDEDAVIAKPDETVIMLQTSAGEELRTRWQVRWVPLTSPSQRLTLLLWRTVRDLEKKLNTPQEQKYVYVIDNSELLRGVVFEFTAFVSNTAGVSAAPRSFRIDNSVGDNKLEMVEGRAELVSILMLGGQLAFVDLEFVIEAQITMCFPHEDYYLDWSVKNLDDGSEVKIPSTGGTRLLVPPRSLAPHRQYQAQGQLYQASEHRYITQAGLVFRTGRRGLELFMMADRLVLGCDSAFYVETKVYNHDYPGEVLMYEWDCEFNGNPCDYQPEMSDDGATLMLPEGLHEPGEYIVKSTAKVKDEEASAQILIEVLDVSLLPVILPTPIHRTVNEDQSVTLVANVSNVAPSCSIGWYFTKEEDLDKPVNDSCDLCQHGEPISEIITVNSLEENFLTELADFSNVTSTVEIEGVLTAARGVLRAAGGCGCSLSFGCGGRGEVYAEIRMMVNESPKPGGVTVSPSSGVALESVFRISTTAAVDQQVPLKYYFYCSTGGEPLLLTYYIEHLVVETTLPYVGGGTDVWVEVCDALGACGKGPPTRLPLSASNGDVAAAAAGEAARGAALRCELDVLGRIGVATIVSFQNMEDSTSLSTFSAALSEVLRGRDAEICADAHFDDYTAMLNMLAQAGFDVSKPELEEPVLFQGVLTVRSEIS